MSQKIKCPECKVEFNMEEGLSSHLKTIEDDVRVQIQKEQGDKIKENSEKVKLLTSENEEKKLQIQKINLEKDNEKKAAVKIAIDATKKDSDKDNKAHYESLYEAKFQERTENQNEKYSERQKLWELREQRYIATVEDLQKKIQEILEEKDEEVLTEETVIEVEEKVSDREWYKNSLYESLIKKWTK